jgi:hypothetical protein
MKAKRVLVLVVLAIISLGGINSALAQEKEEKVNYRVTALDPGKRPVHHKLRTSRANYLALRKLHEYRTPRYRVVIVHPNKVVDETNFKPAANWEIVRE